MSGMPIIDEESYLQKHSVTCFISVVPFDQRRIDTCNCHAKSKYMMKFYPLREKQTPKNKSHETRKSKVLQ